MKNKTLFMLFLLLLFSACERVVVIDLNDAAPALVVEGRVLKDSLALVKVHQTSSYFQPDTQRCICGATVVIREDAAGSSDTLEQIAPGLYQSTTIRGKEDHEYFLTVIFEEVIYEASSYLSPQPQIYSFTQRSFASFGDFADSSAFDFGGGGLLDSLPWFLFTNIYDDPVTADYYMFEYYVNGERRTGRYNVSTDTNAKDDTLKYSPGPSALFYTGDTVSVRVYAIDNGIYNYFDMLSDALNSNSFISSTPYNPISNISNGAMGYFAAMSFDQDTIIIMPVPEF
jgi:hypothetical protein